MLFGRMPKRRSQTNLSLYEEITPKRPSPGRTKGGACAAANEDQAVSPNDDEKKIEYMSPSTIRFSQDKINYKFADGRTLDETLDDLKNGKVTVESIPIITVSCAEKSGQYLTHDNRRLCVFQKYEAYRFSRGQKLNIPVRISTDIHKKRVTTKESGKSVQIIHEGYKSKDKKSRKVDAKVLETWAAQKLVKKSNSK
ncbi:uncharacterized protein LOC123545482 isoform X2 [Mercenaria mercenaria]|uniref:uncharacterized protein LOC123545482 isoform X2 n=1 Tax=Mercenaria mercenaria TaxID=6596 RepID=UPI00234F0F46|nr:uncharacterized protein LOC123545482 isoform X2 [Mercenaria mercenaria]